MSPCLARGCLRTLSNGLLLPPALPDRLFTYNTAKPLLASSIPARLAHAIARATSPIRAHRKWAARRLPSLILLRVFETERKGRGAGMPALRERRVWRMCRWTAALVALHTAWCGRCASRGGNAGANGWPPGIHQTEFKTRPALQLLRQHPGRARSLDVGLLLLILTTWTTPTGIHVLLHA